MSVWFPALAFSVTTGALSFWKTDGDSGNEQTCALCPKCGTRIYHAFADNTDMLSVEGGSLDRIRNSAPIAHIWTRSAQLWILNHMKDEICFETEPGSVDRLVAAFPAVPDR